MKKFIVLFLILIMADSAYAFGVNAAAVNTIKYNQSRMNYNRQYRRNQMPYVYSEQQARYYGINTYPDSQYRQYGTYRQNYSSNTNYGQGYRY